MSRLACWTAAADPDPILVGSVQPGQRMVAMVRPRPTRAARASPRPARHSSPFCRKTLPARTSTVSELTGGTGNPRRSSYRSSKRLYY